MMSKIVSLIFVVLLSATLSKGQSAKALVGAWELANGSAVTTVIFSEKHYAIAEYDREGKKFGSTRGGSWIADGTSLTLTEEFNTTNTDGVGKGKSFRYEIKNGMMVLKGDKAEDRFKRTDDAKPGQLAGAWLITGRVTDNNMQPITPGARRTMKILSGTRFQWIAYNTETKEFFGTGGGTYTTRDGKYAETIDFFSRDNSRVGKVLEFDFKLEDGKWRHKGLSSKGDPIDEVWTKREELGL